MNLTKFNNLADPETVEHAGEIPRQLDRIEGNEVSLSDAIDELERRLTGVLQQDIVTVVCSDDEVESQNETLGCALSDQLSNIADRVQTQRNRISYILDRLHL